MYFPVCNGNIEQLLYVVFDCDFVSNCWHEMGLQCDFWEVEDASSCLLEMLSRDSYEKLATISMTLWEI